MLNFAMPKGRLFEGVKNLLKRAGFEVEMDAGDRILTSLSGWINFTLLKVHDIPVWVERGVADLGIVGSDILRETKPDVFELLDLKIGRCRLSLASLPDTKLEGKIKIATKFPNLTSELLGKEFELIKLEGSVETAPLTGLADAIVDLVSTGETLRKNGLVEVKVLAKFSAYLIANRVSYKLKYNEIKGVLDRIRCLC